MLWRNPERIDKDALRDLWSAGVKVAEISARFGVTPQAVSDRVRFLGLPPRLIRIIDGDEFERLWMARTPREEIARHFGITVRNVMARRHRMGLPLYPEPVLPEPEVGPAAEVVPVVPPVKVITEAKGHPFWTPERDQMVLNTNGSHEAIFALARELKRQSADVRKRWHILGGTK